MKRTLLRAVLAALVVTLMAPLSSLARGGYRTPFETRIIDPETGEGVPNIAVISDNGIICHTQLDGAVRWTESSVMNRDTKFSVAGRVKVTLRPVPGGHVDIRLTR
jgi:hypothetical protein